MRILIFTDSRGEHKETFNDKLIFPEKIKKKLEKKNIKVDLMLCPFGWTTTLDFIECIERKFININNYDKIILYTGIVEHSPRPISNCKMVYDNNHCNDQITLEKLCLGIGKKIPRRIINNKKQFLDSFFGEPIMKKQLGNKLGSIYRNEDTINLISIDMLMTIINYLKYKLGDKLIFINSNRICTGWEGNYLAKNPDGRPKNINIIEKYSEILRNELSNVVDLLVWSDEEIKKYTIDNMHLTFEGSEWIYHKLMERLK